MVDEICEGDADAHKALADATEPTALVTPHCCATATTATVPRRSAPPRGHGRQRHARPHRGPQRAAPAGRATRAAGPRPRDDRVHQGRSRRHGVHRLDPGARRDRGWLPTVRERALACRSRSTLRSGIFFPLIEADAAMSRCRPAASTWPSPSAGQPVVRSGPLGSRGSPAAAARRAAGVPHHQRPGRRVQSGTARGRQPGTAPPAAGGTPVVTAEGGVSSIPARGWIATLRASGFAGTTCARSTPRLTPPTTPTTSWRPPTGHAGGLWRKSGSPTSRSDTSRPTAKLSRPLEIAEYSPWLPSRSSRCPARILSGSACR